MLIRQAIESDKSQLGELYKLLFQEMAALQPKYYQPTEQTLLFIEENLHNEQACLFVAEQQAQLLGFVAAVEQISPAYPCMQELHFAYLLDLAVLPQQRRQGIGSKLLQAVKDWADSRNLHHVAVTVLEENKQAIEFYRRSAYQEAMRTMRLEL